MLAIYKKELRGYFTSMTGYMIIAFIMVMTGVFFSNSILLNGIPDIGYVLSNVYYVIIVVVVAVPVLTMRVIVDEKRQKTDQLILTSPVSILSVVMGKYLAMLTLFAVPIFVICTFPLIMSLYGKVSMLRSYACIFAFFLMCAAAIAVGMFISSLTDNQVIAAVITFAVLFTTCLVSSFSSMITDTWLVSFIACSAALLIAALIYYFSARNYIAAIIIFAAGEAILGVIALINRTLLEGVFSSILDWIALPDRIFYFANGVFSISGILYYLSVCGLFVFLTHQQIQKSRWN